MQIDAWLVSLGLRQYAQVFADNAIDQEALRTLTDADLQQLGIAPLGHRKKLLGAIASLPDSDVRSAVLKELMERLPLVLAGPLDDYLHKPDQNQRLWHMCDFVELSLRLTTFASVGVYGRSLPEDLRRDLSANYLERPTLGNWVGLAMAGVRHLPTGNLEFLPALLAAFTELLGQKAPHQRRACSPCATALGTGAASRRRWRVRCCRPGAIASSNS